jgi:hypothetical protein
VLLPLLEHHLRLLLLLLVVVVHHLGLLLLLLLLLQRELAVSVLLLLVVVMVVLLLLLLLPVKGLRLHLLVGGEWWVKLSSFATKATDSPLRHPQFKIPPCPARSARLTWRHHDLRRRRRPSGGGVGSHQVDHLRRSRVAAAAARHRALSTRSTRCSTTALAGPAVHHVWACMALGCTG